MVTGVEASDVQFDPERVKVKVALPEAIAVITPWLVMVATVLLELVQVPPEVGAMVV